MLRGSGVDWDLRRAQPYLAYDQVDFRVPVYQEGDVWARYRVRMEEMRESVRIVDQALRRMPDGPWIADDRKVVLPPREELHTSMESLIHHFKIVTEGYRVPEGEVYVTIESPRGELGCYVVSDGGPKPWRVKFRAPSFVALEATATCMQRRARRRPDRDRRLARHRDGRGRPVSGFHDEVQELKTRYPDWRSATLPALRLAQEKHGHLSPDALRECADALGTTPAFCESVASFYDMFHLEPDRQAPGGGVHERLVRARRRAAGAGGVRARAGRGGRRDDR